MKFICNMLYGILASESCLLYEIGRNLHEDITLKKTVDRLSRNLHEFDENDKLVEEYLIRAKKNRNVIYKT